MFKKIVSIYGGPNHNIRQKNSLTGKRFFSSTNMIYFDISATFSFSMFGTRGALISWRSEGRELQEGCTTSL